MATVRFSTALRQTIIHNAKNIMEARINAEIKNYPQNIGDRLYDIVLGPYLPIMNTLPQEFFTKLKLITVNSVGEGILPCHVEYPFSNGNERLFPKGYPDTSAVALSQSYYSSPNSFTIKDHADVQHIVAEFRDWSDRVRKLKDRQAEFAAGVKEVIEAYETLAPALAAWPALYDLLPISAKERHEQKVTRTKKEVNIATDIDALTGMVAIKRLGGV